ncbi:MAG: YtxH domain-containing protein [Casimicrobiaceae bacterium]
MGHHRSHGFQRLVQGLAVGAAAMYLLDPDKGRRRRAIVSDRLQRVAHDATHLAHQAARDAGNRLHGVNARLAHRHERGNGSLDELRLIERVRSAMGHIVTHPHAIQVGVRGDTVVLSGPILVSEVRELLDCVHDVPGVEAIENHLDLHEDGNGVPSLQGEGRRRRSAGDAWSPAARMAALLAGGMFALYGVARRGLTGWLLAGAASALARRALAQDGPAQSMATRESGRGWALETRPGAPRIGDDGTPSRGPAHSASFPNAEVPGNRPLEPYSEIPPIGNDGTPSTSAAKPWRSNGTLS